MALHPAFGPKLAGTDALDGRLAFAGLVTLDASFVPRPGILGGPALLVSTRTDMQVDIAAFYAVLSRGIADGVSFIRNDGTTQFTIPAAPSANSRYDVVWVKQNDSVTSVGPDGNNLPVFGVTSGSASATPSLATVLASIPTGALPLASLLVPSTATNTNGMTVSQIFQNTAPLGDAVPFRSVADMQSWTNAQNGQQVFVPTVGVTFQYYSTADGGAAGWFPVPGSAVKGKVQRTTATTIGTATARATVALADAGTSRGGFTASGTAGLVVPYDGDYDLFEFVYWGANATGMRWSSVFVNTNELDGNAIDARAVTNAGAYISVSRTFSFKKNDVVTLGVAQNSGGDLTLQAGTYLELRWRART